MFNLFKRKPKQPTLRERLESNPLWTDPQTFYVAVYGYEGIKEVLVYGIDYKMFSSGEKGPQIFYCEYDGFGPTWHEQGWCNRHFFLTRDDAKAFLLKEARRSKKNHQTALLNATRLEKAYAAL